VTGCLIHAVATVSSLDRNRPARRRDAHTAGAGTHAPPDPQPLGGHHLRSARLL